MKQNLRKISRVIGKGLISQWHIKLACLAVAGALWYYVQRSKISSVTINAPVTYLNKAPDLVFRTAAPRFVKVVVRGREEFLKFPVNNIKAEVDLRNATAGEKKYAVLFDERQLPERTEITEIPTHISLNLQTSIKKLLAVRVILSGSPEDGFRAGKPSVSPEKIMAEGAEPVISQLKELSTEPVNLGGARSALTTQVALALPEGVTVSSKEKIEVSVPIYARDNITEMAIEGVTIKMLNLDSALSASLSDKTVKVFLQGETKTVKRMTASDFIATVNLEDTRYNQQTGSILPYDTETGIPVVVRAAIRSNKVSIISYTPEKISVRFEVKPDAKAKSEEKTEDEKPLKDTRK